MVFDRSVFKTNRIRRASGRQDPEEAFRDGKSMALHNQKSWHQAAGKRDQPLFAMKHLPCQSNNDCQNDKQQRPLHAKTHAKNAKADGIGISHPAADNQKPGKAHRHGALDPLIKRHRIKHPGKKKDSQQRHKAAPSDMTVSFILPAANAKTGAHQNHHRHAGSVAKKAKTQTAGKSGQSQGIPKEKRKNPVHVQQDFKIK